MGKIKYVVKITRKNNLPPNSLGELIIMVVSFAITAISLSIIFNLLSLNIKGTLIGILYYGLNFAISTTIVYPLITKSVTIKFNKQITDKV